MPIKEYTWSAEDYGMREHPNGGWVKRIDHDEIVGKFLEYHNEEKQRIQALETALNAVQAQLAKYLELLLQGRTLPNRWVGEINDIVCDARSTCTAKHPHVGSVAIDRGETCIHCGKDMQDPIHGFTSVYGSTSTSGEAK